MKENAGTKREEGCEAVLALSSPGTSGPVRKYDDVFSLRCRQWWRTVASGRSHTMPRHSPNVVVLTDEERRRLEETSRKYTSPYCDVARAKAILMAAEGLQNKDIGRRLDLPRQIVSKWRKRFCLERLAGLQDRPRRGRPAAFSP